MDARDEQSATPHVIRLRGPWDGPEGRIKLPHDWQTALGERASTTLTRRFNRPANLDPDERVRLRVASPHALGAVRLNDAVVNMTGSTADVTAMLGSANRLAIELVRKQVDHDSLLDVQLEILAPGGRQGLDEG